MSASYDPNCETMTDVGLTVAVIRYHMMPNDPGEPCFGHIGRNKGTAG
jgi:hypothetical protein